MNQRTDTNPWNKEMSMLPKRILLASDVSEEA
jgi:hypothetical protein